MLYYIHVHMTFVRMCACVLLIKWLSDCPFKDTNCHTRGKKGCIAVVCRSAKRDPPGGSKWRGPGRNVHYVDTQHSLEDKITDDCELLYQIGSSSFSLYEVVLEINGKTVKMVTDTGAAVSIILSKTQQAHFLAASISKATLMLHSVTVSSMASMLATTPSTWLEEMPHACWAGTGSKTSISTGPTSGHCQLTIVC